jgi:hypothetical protein
MPHAKKTSYAVVGICAVGVRPAVDSETECKEI